MEQPLSVKMVYSGSLIHISCPGSAKYDDFIEIAMNRFAIPTKFKDFIQVNAGRRFVFSKQAFDTYLRYFPNPEMVFEIQVDLYARRPEDDEDLVLRKKCDIEQPNVKRMRTGSALMEL